MAARLLWAFLTDKDVRDFLDELEKREPGLVHSGGRYFRGDAQELARDPSKLERRESLPGEKRVYLFHRKNSGDIVAHPQTAGPFAGWSQIDEERSDCLVLRLKDSPRGELEPAQLYAHVNFWRAADKVRKRPMFSIWAAQTLKWAKARLGQTAVKFVRIGPDALAKAKGGELRLTYLYREISPG
jgi:hypothetical protein